MDTSLSRTRAKAVIDPPALAQMISSLQRRGFQVIGPVVREGAITYDILERMDDLPVGWGDEQDRGEYRLKKRGDGALFGFTVSCQSWKRFLHPPEVRTFAAEREGNAFRVLDIRTSVKQAFVGVRPCDLAAIRVLDRVLLGGPSADETYQGRREGLFIVAVNCSSASRNCFCTSFGTGPRADSGFDLALTELAGPERHVFVVETGSGAGEELLAELDHREATAGELEEADAVIETAARQITRRLDTSDLPRLLYGNFDHPEWDAVAARCLSCANCTMACPTCFCTTVEDTSDVAGKRAERWRKWDSCFTEAFSYIHGGSVRLSIKSRYRQWLTHKLGSWVDQFGTFGCVGCGRCITWCPAKIDITEEVAAIRENRVVQGG